MDDDYYLRQCLLKRKQVPTQTLIKNKMKESLASVYFKDIQNYRVKVLAGLEPRMIGGCNDWFVSPTDLLKEKNILTPLQKKYLSKIGFTGITDLGERLEQTNYQHKKIERKKAIEDNDKNWKMNIDRICQEQWLRSSKEESKQNTLNIRNAFEQFEVLFKTSITSIETTLYTAAIKAIESIRESAFLQYKIKYELMLKKQATSLYKRYEKRLDKEKGKQKNDFITKTDNNRKHTWNIAHDIHLEKHRAVAKLRHFLECQYVACQMYVAIKEKDCCAREIKEMKNAHKKKVMSISQDIAYTDIEISIAKDKEKQINDFIRIWQLKVCHVVKTFQKFVSYCLKLLPDHVDFFINLEKLLHLQFDEAMENPSRTNIFKEDTEQNDTTIAKQVKYPLTIYGDINSKNAHAFHTSSADVPAFMINKHYVYATCDNIEKFPDKMRDFIHGRKGNDSEIIDDFDYSYSNAVKYETPHKLQELKLESSLMQVLQTELTPIDPALTKCCICKVKHCFCSPIQSSTKTTLNTSTPKKYNIPSTSKQYTSHGFPPGKKVDTRELQIKHERNPKIESYMNFIIPNRCKCPKKAKKQLTNHMPPYMCQTSLYDTPMIPNYITCPLHELQRLVKKYRPTPVVKEVVIIPSKTREVSTQYSDHEFDAICTCFSEGEMEKLYQEVIAGSKIFDVDLKRMCDVMDLSVSDTHLTESSKHFVSQRASELRILFKTSLELQEIFKKSNCNF